MVLDVADFSTENFAWKASAQLVFHPRSLALLAQAPQHHARIRTPEERVGHLPPQVRAGVLVDRHAVHIGEAGIRGTQAIADGFGWKTRPVLDAPKPLFLRRGDKLAVAEQAGGGIAVISVDAEDDQRVTSFTAARLTAWKAPGNAVSTRITARLTALFWSLGQ